MIIETIEDLVAHLQTYPQGTKVQVPTRDDEACIHAPLEYGFIDTNDSWCIQLEDKILKIGEM